MQIHGLKCFTTTQANNKPRMEAKTFVLIAICAISSYNVVLASVVNVTRPVLDCPINEIPSDCASPCPPICSDQREIRCNFLVCNKGCVCKEGYIRLQEQGPCIPLNRCRAVCRGKNEIPVRCAAKEQPTCQRPYLGGRSTTCEGTLCACRSGYIRQYKNGPCIPVERCETSCRENEIFQESASACPKMCHNNSEVCVLIAVQACVCKPGYVLDNDTEKCIKESDCPP